MELHEFRLYSQRRQDPTRSKEWERRHHGLGMIGEVGELGDIVKKWYVYDKPIDVVHVMEEIGDCLFYAAGMAKACDLPLAPHPDYNHEEIETDTNDELVFQLAAAAACCAATAAQHCGQELEELPEVLMLFVTLLDVTARRFNFTLEEAAAANNAKLDVRYAEKGVCLEATEGRDTAAERRAVEGA